MKIKHNSIKIILNSSFAVSLTATQALGATDNPFNMEELSAGYMVSETELEGNCGEGKCGEGKCGSNRQPEKKSMEMKCGEGMCGGMRMDMGGMVMNENTDQLPVDCPAISETKKITVRAGKKYALKYNGTMFGFDQNDWRVRPCAKITVTFINEDEVRHQWMLHGLPKYLYPQGMFHLEANGGYSKTGTFIVPNDDKTYLVHCDISQHMEKGMKAQLKVGNGDGDLPGVPGITGYRNPDKYPE